MYATYDIKNTWNTDRTGKLDHIFITSHNPIIQEVEKDNATKKKHTSVKLALEFKGYKEITKKMRMTTIRKIFISLKMIFLKKLFIAIMENKKGKFVLRKAHLQYYNSTSID